MKRHFLFCVMVALMAVAGCDSSKSGKTPVTPSVKYPKIIILIWNIQNGMWADQGNNYDNFVAWVKSYNPDVCIWCEAKSNYKTDLKQSIPSGQNYLPDGWGELAKRYGHDNWSKGGHRDNFPQVITSKYPIETVQKIIGNQADTVVQGISE